MTFKLSLGVTLLLALFLSFTPFVSAGACQYTVDGSTYDLSPLAGHPVRSFSLSHFFPSPLFFTFPPHLHSPFNYLSLPFPYSLPLQVNVTGADSLTGTVGTFLEFSACGGLFPLSFPISPPPTSLFFPPSPSLLPCRFLHAVLP